MSNIKPNPRFQNSIGHSPNPWTKESTADFLENIAWCSTLHNIIIRLPLPVKQKENPLSKGCIDIEVEEVADQKQLS